MHRTTVRYSSQGSNRGMLGSLFWHLMSGQLVAAATSLATGRTANLLHSDGQIPMDLNHDLNTFWE